MSKHTPGPWGCVDTSNHAHDYRLTKPNGSPLPLHAEANDHSEQRANARLIAAAPELLAAVTAIHLAYKAEWTPLDRDQWLALTGMTKVSLRAAHEMAEKAMAKATTPPA